MLTLTILSVLGLSSVIAAAPSPSCNDQEMKTSCTETWVPKALAIRQLKNITCSFEEGKKSCRCNFDAEFQIAKRTEKLSIEYKSFLKKSLQEQQACVPVQGIMTPTDQNIYNAYLRDVFRSCSEKEQGIACVKTQEFFTGRTGRDITCQPKSRRDYRGCECRSKRKEIPLVIEYSVGWTRGLGCRPRTFITAEEMKRFEFLEAEHIYVINDKVLNAKKQSPAPVMNVTNPYSATSAQ